MLDSLIILGALTGATALYAATIRRRARRRPVERRLRELEPIIAPWLQRAGAGR
jgi:hypothetical protein